MRRVPTGVAGWAAWACVTVAAPLCAFGGPPPQAAPPARATVPAADAPNDELMEFLGGDDVGDAEWWEFLKTSGARPGDARRPASGGPAAGAPASPPPAPPQPRP